MRTRILVWIAGVLALLFWGASSVYGDEPTSTPFMQAVDPASGKPGVVVTVTGLALDKTKVKNVYLTDGKADHKMEVVEQAEKSLKFKIPEKTPTGRFALMVLTVRDPKYIEQPVYLIVTQ